MIHRQPIGEIDLLAYADGLLDDDPGRKAEVETYLLAHPVEASRLRDYAQQNEEIRKLYGSAMTEPVPDRLQAVLCRRSGQSARYAARAAVAASLFIAAGLIGWSVGRSERPGTWHADEFIQRAMTDYLLLDGVAAPQEAVLQTAGMQPLSWLSDRIATDLRPPSLANQGFKLLDRRLISADGQRVVRLTYAGPGGRRLNLFVRPRWEDQPPRINFAENGDVTMAYWSEGPFAFGLAGKLDRREMRAFAQAARQSMTVQAAGVVPESGLPALKTEIGIRPTPGSAVGKGIAPDEIGFAPIEVPSPAEERTLPN